MNWVDIVIAVLCTGICAILVIISFILLKYIKDE